MGCRFVMVAVFTILSWAAASQPGWATQPSRQSSPAAESGGDRTLAPFFFVQGQDPSTDQLPLKSTEASIRILGAVAHVTVVQRYCNEGQRPLEAIYVFPASTRAALHAMRMSVGERVIEAEIMEKEKARKTYQQAREDGRTTSLLEQQRPNVFQMSVANILPGDEIRVELKYTEIIVPEDGSYEFVYPAVVGPRYSSTPEVSVPEAQRWVQTPYLHSGLPAPYRFGMDLEITSGIPIERVSSPSHPIEVEHSSSTQARVRVKEDPRSGTKDFVLRYSLAGKRIQAGLLLHRDQTDNYFLLMLEPPARVASEDLLPREYIFIVDVSGSMHGFPLEVSKLLMAEIIEGLGPRDSMNVLLFSGGSAVLSPTGSLPATEENKRRALSWIRSQRGGGGTELLPALERALSLPRTAGSSRIVVVATDGFVTVEPEAFELIRRRLGEANLFAFGIGSSVNRHLIEGMARAGAGEPFVILNEQEARLQAARFKQYIQAPLLTDIRVGFRGFKAHDVEPLTLPDLFALRPLVLAGKYEGSPSGEIVIQGKTPNGQWERVIPVTGELESTENQALGLLWARHRIMRLSDLNGLRQDKVRQREITELGLKHSLITQFTSFVAADKVKRSDGSLVTVKQPLPLPEGVSDLAVGSHLQAASKLAPPSPRQAQEMGSGQLEGSPYLPGKRDKAHDSKLRPLGVQVEDFRGELEVKRVERALEVVLGKVPCLLTQGEQWWEAVIKIELGSDGKILSVELLSASLADPSLPECLKGNLVGRTLGSGAVGGAQVIVKIRTLGQASR